MTSNHWNHLEGGSLSAPAAVLGGDQRSDGFAIGSDPAMSQMSWDNSARINNAANTANSISGDPFNNTLRGTTAQDTILAEQGADTVTGGRSADVIHGNAGADDLYGNAGTDVLYGNTGKDRLHGNAGTDVLYGNTGKDRLFGFQNNDIIFGGKANDRLFGGKGKDRLAGGRGNDTIRGGKGSDVLVGGFGADVFVLAPGTGGARISQSDLISDFTVGQDAIRLAGGLTPEDLVVIRDAENTIIRDKATGEVFAVLQGVNGDTPLGAGFPTPEVRDKIPTETPAPPIPPPSPDRPRLPAPENPGNRVPPPGSNLPPREVIDNAPIKPIDPPIPPPNTGTGTERPVPRDPGNTVEAALDIAGSSNTLTYREQVSASDPEDFYAFSVGASSTLTLTLTGLSQNADLFLLDSAGNVIQRSEESETAGEFIAQPVETGTYNIQVKAADAETTDYNLNVTLISNLPGMTTEASDEVDQLFTFESSRLIRLEPSIDNNGTFNQGFRNDARFVGIDGRGFSTVILDTGIDLDHPFFGPDTDGNGVADRIVYSYDFADNDADANDSRDPNHDSHGSNVSSIVASQDEFETGMAPGANIIHLKVFSDAGGGARHEDIQEALQWVVANAERYNIASVNMSLGSGNNGVATSGSIYADELLLLRLQNVIVAAAAGNDFFEFESVPGVAYPASDPNVLAVSASWDENVGRKDFPNPDGTPGSTDYSTGAYRATSFSQRHPNLTDIFAPGGLITGANRDGGTIDKTGTSQASPHIAGIAVLGQQLAVQELGRRLTFEEFRNAMITSAALVYDGDDEDDNVTNTGSNYAQVSVQGLGEYILYLASIENPPPPPPPPIPVTQYNFVYLYDGAMGTSNENYTGYTYAPPGSLAVGTLYDPSAAPNERGTNGAYFIISEQPAPNEALLGQVFVQQYNGAAIPRPNSSSTAIPYYFSIGSPSGFNGLGSEIDFAQTRDANGQPILELFGADFWAADISSVATDIGLG